MYRSNPGIKTPALKSEANKAEYISIALIEDIKIKVPPVYASFKGRDGQRKSLWRAGVLNRQKKQVLRLGFGEAAIRNSFRQKLSEGEAAFCQTIHRLKDLSVNMSFFGLRHEDFGKAICCQAEIKEKVVGPKRYTEISLYKKSARGWKRKIAFEKTPAQAEQSFRIHNAQEYLNILPLVAKQHSGA